MEENRDIKHMPACCVCSWQYEMNNDTSIDVNININTKINTNIDIFINEQMMNNVKTAAVTMALVNLA